MIPFINNPEYPLSVMITPEMGLHQLVRAAESIGIRVDNMHHGSFALSQAGYEMRRVVDIQELPFLFNESKRFHLKMIKALSAINYRNDDGSLGLSFFYFPSFSLRSLSDRFSDIYDHKFFIFMEDDSETLIELKFACLREATING